MVKIGALGALIARHGWVPPSKKIEWEASTDLVEVKKLLWAGIRSALPENERPQAIPQYADIADWLYRNEGRGLLIYGGCGLGKTLLLSKVLPFCAFYLHKKVLGKCYSAVDLCGETLDEVLRRRIVLVDDLGTETLSQWKDPAIPRIVDNLEKNEGLFIGTTNLSGEQMYERYGERVVDRLAKICKIVHFEGQSFRTSARNE